MRGHDVEDDVGEPTVLSATCKRRDSEGAGHWAFQLKQNKELQGKKACRVLQKKKNLDFRRSEGEDSCVFFAIFLPVSS